MQMMSMKNIAFTFLFRSPDSETCPGRYIPRKSNFFGKWLEYGGPYPDYHLRLARKGKHHYDLKIKVYEIPNLYGKVGYLKNPLIHYWYQSKDEMLEARSTYFTLKAEVHYEAGIRPIYHLLAASIFFFTKQLIFLKGYKDGWVGLLISLVRGYFAFVEHWSVWRFWKGASKKGEPSAQNTDTASTSRDMDSTH
ncbi:MAG: hypothetical protein A2Y88_10260 [Chloroflexi bacterium RBG_13_48_10]|nr:MAG: hypothetical protein A2Y88_10260 [Chloroflexi bacterium RBG_13_48_10]